MIHGFWNGVWATVATLVVTSLFELLLKPRPRLLWQRAPAAVAVHLATAVLHFAFWLLIVQRPWFALVIAASLQMVVIQVNNTKSSSLREPFLCQDFEYFVDAVRHPRLYIPFFGIGLTIAASLAGAIAIGIGFWLEPSLYGHADAPWSLLGTLVLVAASIAVLIWQLPRLTGCTLEPNDDLVRLGLYPYLWAYGRLTREPIDRQDNDSAFALPVDLDMDSMDPATLPNVVLVQSESFFDPRDWHQAIRRDLLGTYDALMAEALQAGRFDVPAWGANTVRTECAVLTGLTPSRLGVHRFNPYHQLSKLPVNNLAGALKRLGYRTVCIHPYPASFYLRDKVYPNLGFETFVDIADFDIDERDGQYTGDLALAERVRKRLTIADEKPLFIFVISMENHGPLHLETADPAVAERWVEGGVTDDCEELTVYLKHLRNTDSMLERLRDSLHQGGRPGILGFYGDHVPIMPKVYARHGEPDGFTNYFIWQTAPRSGDNVRMTLPADKLGVTIYDRIIDHAGRRGAN
ncbi:LTA synthase family protein [Salinicola corii]|uniref:LTA synthase family protein n=1 Tax=Salinicola corii TaxID=2606937 RepID=A0A640WFJ9_9GAMM|nr:LTA synthase family protein [Salinicola corii]KAA0019039.1 LTA synthase family protein [Salinicola corii]